MARARGHATAVDAIYAAAIEPAKWPDALAVLARVCGADSASYNRQHVTRSVGTRTTFGYEFAGKPRYYDDGFATRNPLFRGLLDQPVDVPYPHQALVDDKSFRRGVYFNGYCRPNGLHNMAGLIIARRGQMTEWISINRGPGGYPYERGQLDGLARLASHLRCASETSRRLAEAHAARTAWEAAVDLLHFGLVLLDECGRVVFANQAARRLDAARDGVTLRRDGVTAPAVGCVLARAIVEAADGTGEGVREGARLALPRRATPVPLSAIVFPLPRESTTQWPGTPSVLLLISDPAQPPSPDADTIKTAFGLTDREAEIAVLLCSGHRLDDAAAQLGIGRETARTHLAHTLGKTGTERQADLVRLLVALALPVAGAPARS